EPSRASRRYLSSRVLPTSAPPSFAAKSTVSLFVLISHPRESWIIDFHGRRCALRAAILNIQTLYSHSYITPPTEQSNLTAHCLTMQSKIQNRRRAASSHENPKSFT